MNSADQVLARTFAGPSNPSRIGVESAVRAIEDCGNLALRETGFERSAISAVGAGIAGTAKPEMKESVTRALQKSFAGASITVLTDLEAGLAAAGEGPAIILVMGTGSAAFGRNAEGEVARAGGYGPASSDQGSAYDIGRRASLIADVAERLHLRESEFLLAKIGGTAGRSRFFDAQIDAALKQVVPSAQVGKLRVSPAEAAALVAKGSDAS